MRGHDKRIGYVYVFASCDHSTVSDHTHPQPRIQCKNNMIEYVTSHLSCSMHILMDHGTLLLHMYMI